MKRGLCALSLLCVGLVGFGCQSRPAPEVHYYLLKSAFEVVSPGRIEIARVTLPDYLQGTNLMLAVSEYEIRPAQYHHWIEPLEYGIRRVLEAELSVLLEGADKGPLKIDLDIELFHATESGIVLLSGTWKRIGAEGEGNAYAIQSDLSEGGYAAAVEAHVGALASLARSIGGTL